MRRRGILFRPIFFARTGKGFRVVDEVLSESRMREICMVPFSQHLTKNGCRDRQFLILFVAVASARLSDDW
jgi:hypothetical protein